MGGLIPGERNSQVIFRVAEAALLVIIRREIPKADIDVWQQSPQAFLPVLAALLLPGATTTTTVSRVVEKVMMRLVGVGKPVLLLMLLLLTVRGTTQGPTGKGGSESHGVGETRGVIQVIQGRMGSSGVTICQASSGGWWAATVVAHTEVVEAALKSTVGKTGRGSIWKVQGGKGNNK